MAEGLALVRARPGISALIASIAGTIGLPLIPAVAGLQQALDDQLRGTPGLVVEAVRDGDGEGDESADDESEDADPRPLHEIDAADGGDVSITLRRNSSSEPW